MHKSHTNPNLHKLPNAHKNKKPVSIILKITLMICFLGLTFGALASGFNINWMVAGVIAGAIGGFLIGLAVDKALAKKKIK